MSTSDHARIGKHRTPYRRYRITDNRFCGAVHHREARHDQHDGRAATPRVLPPARVSHAHSDGVPGTESRIHRGRETLGLQFGSVNWPSADSRLRRVR
jgi:hypothetical protein